MTSIDTSAVRLFDDVLAKLDVLEEQLRRDGLSQFLTFNRAYIVVTATIKDAANDGYFESPLFIEQFTICFADYYFHAVNDTSAGSAELPVAWARMNDKRIRSMPAFVSLLLGANAHINRDLPLALVQFMDKQEGTSSLRDIRRVDRLLLRSAPRIVDTIEEPNRVLDIMKNKLRFLYLYPAILIILYWRVAAWQSYQAIRRQGITAKDLDKRSRRVADRLMILGRLMK